MERMSEHTGLISSYQLLITAVCTNTGGKMKGSHSRAADRCPLVLRHSLSQVTSFTQWWQFFLHILEVVPDLRSLDERNYLCHRILFTVSWTNLDPAREQHGEMEKEERERVRIFRKQSFSTKVSNAIYAYTYGLGHGTVAVLLPGFSINW